MFGPFGRRSLGGGRRKAEAIDRIVFPPDAKDRNSVNRQYILFAIAMVDGYD